MSLLNQKLVSTSGSLFTPFMKNIVGALLPAAASVLHIAIDTAQVRHSLLVILRFRDHKDILNSSVYI